MFYAERLVGKLSIYISGTVIVGKQEMKKDLKKRFQFVYLDDEVTQKEVNTTWILKICDAHRIRFCPHT